MKKKIKITKGGPWVINGNMVNFAEGQTLKVGTDVPDKIAEDMIKNDYAEVVDNKPKIETKEVAEEKSEDKPEEKKTSKRGKKGDKK